MIGKFKECLQKINDKLKEVDDSLEKIALIKILARIEHITIVIVLISFILTEKQRRNAEIYQAWQVITAAYKQPGSGGRKEALEFLNSEPRRFPWIWLTWERQNLAGLAAPKAYFHEINLQEADLRFANLQETNLLEANLQATKLFEADLHKANLLKANLSEATLKGANLSEAILKGATLKGADLQGVNFKAANLWEANLQAANLWAAKLQVADLLRANLSGANLHQANLREVNLRQANLSGVNLQQANLKGANLHQANLKGVILEKAINLNFKQLKSACFWEEAIYKGGWNSEKATLTPIEPDNTKFIEEVKQYSSSDNENSIDCTLWNK